MADWLNKCLNYLLLCVWHVSLKLGHLRQQTFTMWPVLHVGSQTGLRGCVWPTFPPEAAAKLVASTAVTKRLKWGWRGHPRPLARWLADPSGPTSKREPLHRLAFKVATTGPRHVILKGSPWGGGSGCPEPNQRWPEFLCPWPMR